MTTILKNGHVFTSEGFLKQDVLIKDNRTHLKSNDDANREVLDSQDVSVIDCTNMVIMPGFVDVHVHLREPGFFYKETIKSGSEAAAKGGYTCVCTMPNVNPAPSNMESLNVQLDIIKRDAKVRIVPYGTITQKGDGRSELSDMEDLAPYVVAFSDDGRGVQTGDLMEDAMIKARSLNKLIVAHCEDESLLDGGYIHDGIYAALNHHKGISSKSEWIQVQRDIELSEKLGCGYHICHVSSKESVALIRAAKKRGANVSCETAPHYLILSDEDLKEEGRFKMNPPLRDKSDRQALIEGIKDGSVDVIATDHAPHSKEEKSKGLAGSPFGIVGLETAFSLLYTELVKKGIITLEKLIELMCINPRKRFKLPGEYYVKEDGLADLVVVDLNKESVIDSSSFASMGKATPFDGYKVNGFIEMTIVDGKIVYQRNDK